jgi:predicted anti-sigma-YlaC factor YlaD
MQHLSTEELARLIEETPGHQERAHLAACDACRDELKALREQTRALAQLGSLPAPERVWPVLAARLRHEGLIATSASARGFGTLLRAAVLAGLFLLGGAVGLAVGRSGTVPTSGGFATESEQFLRPVLAHTAAEAAQQLEAAETAYLAALSRYTELTSTPAAIDPAARLAALEGIVLSTRAALEAAPADPVINGYYLTAMGQREAVLRQIVQATEDPWF